MKRILVTGFSKFGDYPQNSSLAVLKMLDRGALARHAQVVTETLAATIPTYDRGEIVFTLACEHNVDGIICLGMASEKKGLSIETVSYNKTGGKYCPPELQGKPIDPRLPINHSYQWQDELKWNTRAFRSCSVHVADSTVFSVYAGDFCCNHLMYQLSRAQRSSVIFRDIPWIFIHIPCSIECIPRSRLAFYEAGKVIMEPDEVITGLYYLVGNSLIGNPATMYD